jgi:uncharacterized Zn-finger protein
MIEKIKICFAVPDAYSLFDTKTRFLFGGAEVRASLFAKYLAKHNNTEVTFITSNHGQRPIQIIDGVKVLSDRYLISEQQLNLPFKKLKKTFSTHSLKWAYYITEKKKNYADYLKNYWLQKINADFYFVFSMTNYSQTVINYCIQNKKKYVLFLASDEQVNILEKNKLQLKPEVIEKSIQNAHLIIAQNTFQREKVKSLFRKESTIIKNPVVISKDTIQKTGKSILWVGKANAMKHPMLFIDLAKKHTEKKFVMICSNDSSSLFEEIQKNIPGNIEFHESLSLQETENIFAKASIYISTSEFEGFPNTFLQAGNYKLPVISTMVNPDNYITDRNCGLICKPQLYDLSAALNKLENDEVLYCKMARNHFNYVNENHEATKVVDLLYQQLAA